MKEWVPESAEFIPELDKWLFFSWWENSLESAKGRIASEISQVLRNFCLDFDFANMKAEFCLIWGHRPAGMLLLEGEPSSGFCNWPCSWFILNNRWNTISLNVFKHLGILNPRNLRIQGRGWVGPTKALKAHKLEPQLISQQSPCGMFPRD